jgi:flagellar motor switch protein FliN/FliY
MSEPGAATVDPPPAAAERDHAAPVNAAVRPHPVLDQASCRGFYSLPVEIVVCVGTARPALGELLAMGSDAVILLDRRLDDPVDIRVGDRVIARGELQELEDGSGRLGVRLTQIVDRGKL